MTAIKIRAMTASARNAAPKRATRLLNQPKFILAPSGCRPSHANAPGAAAGKISMALLNYRFFVEHGALQAGADSGRGSENCEATSWRPLIATARLGKLEEGRAAPIE
ncbi:MAG: hypothetical protein WC617_18510 [Rhodanobacter sp.]